MSQEVADAFDRDVSRTIGLRVASVLALARKDRGDALAPGLLDRGQDPRLVVHMNVVLRWIALLDVIQRLFLVDIKQHKPLHALTQPAHPIFSRWKSTTTVESSTL